MNSKGSPQKNDNVGDPFVNAHLNAPTMGELEDKVHPKGSGRKRAEMADVLLQQGGGHNCAWRMPNPPALHMAATRVRSREIRSHRRDHNWRIDPKPLAEACL